MSNSTRPSLYLAGSTNAGSAALLAALALLTAAGYLVSTPTDVAGIEDVETLTAVMAADVDAFDAASAVVALPDSDDVWEVVAAHSLGVPVVSVADALAWAAQ
ncbi:hypothetical protein ACFY2R_17120 [Micromonospora olivasterospora]|uniref:Uncharacterized protein n=1 Tax=Micromonospora olivasterospora TaxID=1880 RepID=A0A562IC64_MICOL|nr:hypothetical protein [Micromonospora olivasterospora]TWH68446.1 hypothetical protein JD77_03439 [Micromonospora olivasterospora]